MKVAILGAGAIGLATAAFLAAQGHEPVVWSPSGRNTAGLGEQMMLEAAGALSGRWPVAIAHTIAQALDGADAVVMAVDANGHAAVMAAAVPHLRDGQLVVIGAAHAMTALHLSKLLFARGVALPIVSWSTTIGTAHKSEPDQVTVRSIRPRIDLSVMPQRDAEAVLARCRKLFGDRFTLRSNALEVALLANCNPVFHVPVALFNLTRIEHRESWQTYEQTTETVGRLIEALDAERLAIAAAFGATIHSVNEHFHRSFRIPLGSMAEMNRTLHAAGRGPKGATSLTHRHLMQDIPYGLVFAADVARVAGVAAPIHDAAIAITSAALDRDFRSDGVLSQMGLSNCTRAELLTLAADGWSAAASSRPTTMRTA
jgi:opine dehydrogenase